MSDISNHIRLKKNPFVKKKEEYICRLSPFKGYKEQLIDYTTKSFNISEDKAKEYLNQMFKENNYEVPMVTYNGLNKVRDSEVMKKPLDTYISDAIHNDQFITPSFTIYSNPKKLQSIHTGYVDNNLKLRTIEKNKSKQAEKSGDIAEYLYRDVLQKVRKVFNNSLSGAYASKSTILCNPSAHYTLTSMTRAVASVGNAITEMISGGNRHYTSTDTILAHFVSTVTNVDMAKIRNVINKHHIHIPTIKEIMTIVERSSSLYFKDPKGFKRIEKYLRSVTDENLVAIAYVNDLYQLRIHNEALVRDMVRGLGTTKDHPSSDNYDILKESPEWVTNLAHRCSLNHLAGVEVKYDTLHPKIRNRLVATTESIVGTLNYYQELFEALFVTPILPIDIVDVKTLIRRVIAIGDTDSTCGSNGEWVEWYWGKMVFGERGAGISGAVMTIVTQVMDHYIKELSSNMNMSADKLDILEMKNEFFWETVVPLDVSKHYYAGVTGKEGFFYKEPKLEIKGVHLINSSVPERYKVRSQEMFTEILTTIKAGEHIDLEGYIKEVADMEKEIFKLVKDGDVSILKNEKINKESIYNQGWKQSTYYHYKLWEEVFEPKYGKIDQAPISVFKINTNLVSKGKIKKWMNGIEDTALRERMKTFYAKHEKGSLGSFKLPTSIGSDKGIPEELMGVINVSKSVANICSVFYLILETCGFYKKTNVTLTEIGY